MRRATAPVPSCLAAAVRAPVMCTGGGALARLSAASRAHVVFTPQSDVLINNAKHLGLASPVWVEAEDKYWTDRLTPLRAGQVPTELPVARMHDFYNLECVADWQKIAAELPDANGQHSSVLTKRPYSRAVAAEFERVARGRGYTSQYWVAAKNVRINKTRLVRGARPANIRIVSRARLFNADQFEQPDLISQTPVSAYKGTPFGGAVGDTLRAHAVAQKYPTGLYLTPTHLDLFGLADKLVDGATPVTVEFKGPGGGSGAAAAFAHSFYSVDDVEDAGRLLEQLQRFPVEVDTFLISGQPVTEPALAELMRGAKRKSKYWVSRRDLDVRKFALKPAAVGVESRAGGAKEGQASATVFYNAAQLTDPQLAYTLVGTKTVI